jgi:hypothetical protein
VEKNKQRGEYLSRPIQPVELGTKVCHGLCYLRLCVLEVEPADHLVKLVLELGHQLLRSLVHFEESADEGARLFLGYCEHPQVQVLGLRLIEVPADLSEQVDDLKGLPQKTLAGSVLELCLGGGVVCQLLEEQDKVRECNFGRVSSLLEYLLNDRTHPAAQRERGQHGETPRLLVVEGPQSVEEQQSLEVGQSYPQLEK